MTAEGSPERVKRSEINRERTSQHAKQKQRGIVGSGGKLINHGDTEITKRGKRKLETGNWRMERGFTRRRGERGGGAEGAVDRIYRIYRIYRILTDGG